MKKTTFGCICVYGFSLIAAILLLIFKSRISEDSYLIARLLLFGYSILTSTPLFLPGFTACLVWLLKKIFRNITANPNNFPEDSSNWWNTVIIVLLLDALFNMTLIIPIAVIIQSSYVLYRIAKNHKTLSLTNPEE